MALGVLVDDFVVTHGREGLGVPVHHPDALVDPALAVEIHEGIDNSLGQRRFHRETGAVPVAGATQLAELLQDDSAVLLLPRPGVLEEFLAADVLLGDAHGLEFRDHLGFGGDGGMVRSRHPAGILAVHAGVADQDVVQGIVEDVTHVQDTRHIGRRDHDGIRFSHWVRNGRTCGPASRRTICPPLPRHCTSLLIPCLLLFIIPGLTRNLH